MRIIFRFTLVLLAALFGANSLRAQWVQTFSRSGTNDINCLAVSGTDIICGGPNGVFVSSDSGATWTADTVGLTSLDVYSLAVSPNGTGGTDLFAGTMSGGIFRSTDIGGSWSAANSGLPANTSQVVVSSIVVAGSNLFAGTYTFGENYDGCIYRSTNNGSTWSIDTTGLGYKYINALAVTPGGGLFTGTTGVFLSTDNGANWSIDTSGIGVLFVNVIFAYKQTILAGTNGAGVYRWSSDSAKWTAVNAGLTSGSISSFALSGNSLFAGSLDGPNVVYLSTDNGTSWTPVDSGLITPEGGGVAAPNIMSLAVFGANIFAGTSNGVWRRPLSEMVTGIENTRSEVPKDFSLSQNYPNPFNPSTIIRYRLPTNAFVTLKVYDVLGRLVKTLVDEARNAGSHSVDFNGSSLPSGVYFYRIQAGNYTATKKLMLVK